MSEYLMDRGPVLLASFIVGAVLMELAIGIFRLIRRHSAEDKAWRKLAERIRRDKIAGDISRREPGSTPGAHL